MRIRSIKPEFWRSDNITTLPVEDRLLFIGLWSYVDDNGVGRDDLAHILGDLFSHDWLESPRETVARVSGGLSRLQKAGLITRYEANGKPYLHVATWSKHQRVDKPANPRYPLPDPHQQADRDEDPEPSGESREDLAPGTGEQGSKEQGNRGTGGGTRKRATRIPDPFTVTRDMRQWAATEVPAVDVDASTRAFVDHWRSVSGRNASRLDWVATWRNWLRKDQEHAHSRRPREQTPRPSKDDRALETLRMGADVQAALEARNQPSDTTFALREIPA